MRGFIAGVPDLEEAIRRLKAYAAAGADCLYAPGIRTREEIAAVVNAVAPKPVNLLIGGAIGLSVGDAAELGVRRISVGGALARAPPGAAPSERRDASPPVRSRPLEMQHPVPNSTACLPRI